MSHEDEIHLGRPCPHCGHQKPIEKHKPHEHIEFPDVSPCRDCGSLKLHWHGTHKPGEVLVLTHELNCQSGKSISVFHAHGPEHNKWNES